MGRSFASRRGRYCLNHSSRIRALERTESLTQVRLLATTSRPGRVILPTLGMMSVTALSLEVSWEAFQ